FLKQNPKLHWYSDLSRQVDFQLLSIRRLYRAYVHPFLCFYYFSWLADRISGLMATSIKVGLSFSSASLSAFEKSSLLSTFIPYPPKFLANSAKSGLVKSVPITL